MWPVVAAPELINYDSVFFAPFAGKMVYLLFVVPTALALPFNFSIVLSALRSLTHIPRILWTLNSGNNQWRLHSSQLNRIVFISRNCIILLGGFILTVTKHYVHGKFFCILSASESACLLPPNEIRQPSHARAWQAGHSRISAVMFMQTGHSKYSV